MISCSVVDEQPTKETNLSARGDDNRSSFEAEALSDSKSDALSGGGDYGDLPNKSLPKLVHNLALQSEKYISVDERCVGGINNVQVVRKSKSQGAQRPNFNDWNKDGIDCMGFFFKKGKKYNLVYSFRKNKACMDRAGKEE